MGSYLQILALVTIGIILLWLGYTLFFGPFATLGWSGSKKNKQPKRTEGSPGDPQICPVCSTKLNRGEPVKSMAFPSLSGGRDRLMYIRGCYYCLEGDLIRRCPVCGITLYNDDYLISRMFERSDIRKHVHVMGCNICKKAGSILR